MRIISKLAALALASAVLFAAPVSAIDLPVTKYISTPASPAVATTFSYSHGNSGGVPSGRCRNGTSDVLGAGNADARGQCVPVSIASAGGSTTTIPGKPAVAAVCTTDVVGIANPAGHPNGAHSHTGAC